MATKTLFIILGNQLFPLNELSNFKDCQFLMAEDYNLCTYEKHHKHKLVLFLSAMRKYAASLKNKKFLLKYYFLNKKNSNLSYEDKIINFIKSKKISDIKMFEIEDKFFEKRIIDFCTVNKLNITFIQSPMFYNSRQDFHNYLARSKKPFMATFYKQQRIEKNILMLDGNPMGGKWSFDEENRKKIPESLTTPSFSAILLIIVLLGGQQFTYGLDSAIPGSDPSEDDLDENIYNIIPDALRWELAGFSILDSSAYSGNWYLGSFGSGSMIKAGTLPMTG